MVVGKLLVGDGVEVNQCVPMVLLGRRNLCRLCPKQPPIAPHTEEKKFFPHSSAVKNTMPPNATSSARTPPATFAAVPHPMESPQP